MLKKITSYMTIGKAKKENDLLDLSSGEQKKIIKEAARKANRDQLKLIKEYERKFGHLKTNTCE